VITSGGTSAAARVVRDLAVESAVVEPVDVAERGELDVVEPLPGLLVNADREHERSPFETYSTTALQGAAGAHPVELDTD
jgi:hypothetical protein